MMRSTDSTPILIGQQYFDGLTRPTSLKAGGRTRTYGYVAAQLPATSLTMADGKSITYQYVHELGDQFKQVKAANEPADDISYEPKLGLIKSRESALGRQTMTYTPSGQPLSDTWRVDGVDHVTHWQHSLQGLLLSFEDPNKVKHVREFDASGRICHLKTDQTACTTEYDEFSRPCKYTTTASATGDELVQSLTYDELGREAIRTFTTSKDGQKRVIVQSLKYTDLDQVSTRQWVEGSVTNEETYRYDALGRLVHYTASPGAAQDSFGNCVVEQSYSLNLLDGYETVRTKFADGSSDTATYHYDNTDDPCQVSAIDHTHPNWPECITLHYDLRGRLISDSLGRSLTWDGLDRVTRVEYQGQTCDYAYDPSGNICDRIVEGRLARSFHSADQMTHEQRDDHTFLVMGDADIPYAISQLAKGVHQGTVLLGCDVQRSVRLEVGDEVSSRQYTAHGAESLAQFSPFNPFGFAGERREPLTGWYIPGGYRPYDPLLMIFLAPDSESPFGEGGLNSYAYCGGDPVNRVDPSGHSAWPWIELGIGLVLGSIALALSVSAALPLLPVLFTAASTLTPAGILSLVSTGLSIVSLTTGTVGTIIKLHDPDSKDAAILGHVSFVTGALASITGSVEKIGAKLAAKSMNKPIGSLGRSASRASSLSSRTSSRPSLPSRASGASGASGSSGSSGSSPALSRSSGSPAVNGTRSNVRPIPDEIQSPRNVIADPQRPITDIGPKTPRPTSSPSGASDVPAGPRTELVHQTARSPLESTIPLPPSGPVNRTHLAVRRLKGPAAPRRLYDYHETTV